MLDEKGSIRVRLRINRKSEYDVENRYRKEYFIKGISRSSSESKATISACILVPAKGMKKGNSDWEDHGVGEQLNIVPTSAIISVPLKVKGVNTLFVEDEEGNESDTFDTLTKLPVASSVANKRKSPEAPVDVNNNAMPPPSKRLKIPPSSASEDEDDDDIDIINRPSISTISSIYRNSGFDSIFCGEKALNSSKIIQGGAPRENIHDSLNMRLCEVIQIQNHINRSNQVLKLKLNEIADLLAKHNKDCKL
jgi:hypothetical protein